MSFIGSCCSIVTAVCRKLWLGRNGSGGESLLLSGSRQGFTGVICRDKHPLIIRTVTCTEEEFEDEFYRFLLFYRDRSVPETVAGEEWFGRRVVVVEWLEAGLHGCYLSRQASADHPHRDLY